MKDYLSLWAEGLPNQHSRVLSAPITVLGKRIKQHGPKSEFAKVQLTVHPSDSFEVIDRIAERSELEKLGVGWPDCVHFWITRCVDVHGIRSAVQGLRRPGKSVVPRS